MMIEFNRINRKERIIRVIRDIIRNTAKRSLTRIITGPPSKEGPVYPVSVAPQFSWSGKNG